MSNTLSYGLLSSSSSPPSQIQDFSDADRAGCPGDQESTSGYLIHQGNNLMSWSAGKPWTNQLNLSIELLQKSTKFK
jgi:hypothetical protein